MEFKVGDKVRLKTLDEILATGEFVMSNRGAVDYKSGLEILLMKHEIKYCGQEFKIKYRLGYDGHYTISNGEVVILNISPLALEPIKEIKLVDLKTAVEALKSGDCDAIRFENNKTVCAYLDRDGGVFKVVKYHDKNKSLDYTNQPFFMHEDYLFDSKWELIIDEHKRKHKDKVNKAKEQAIDSLFNLYFTAQEFTLDDYNQIREFIDKIKC